MGAKPFAEYQGAPADILTSGDVSIRPRYAEWYDADIYIALHSNASGIADFSGGGSVTYRYNCGTFAQHSDDPPASQCGTTLPAPISCSCLVHQRMVEKIKADFDPSWRDRGTKVANFGEVRSLDDMPGILIESAFHDNVQLDQGAPQRMTDNQALHDPRWRRATAYGIYEGISEYFGASALVAEPPDALALKRAGPTSVEVSFTPVPGAMGYRVYVAAGNRTYDQGRLADAPPFVIDNLPEDQPISVRVASLNTAGEGRRSAAVVARASARPAQVLLIDGFEREDAWVQEFDNRGDTLTTHALALSDLEVAFDSANEAGWTAGLVDVSGYEAVIVSLGRESTEHEVLSRPLRDQLLNFVAQGGALLASGAEIGWGPGPARRR